MTLLKRSMDKYSRGTTALRTNPRVRRIWETILRRYPNIEIELDVDIVTLDYVVIVETNNQTIEVRGQTLDELIDNANALVN